MRGSGRGHEANAVKDIRLGRIKNYLGDVVVPVFDFSS
jgi:hypothetical protein